MAEGRGFFTYVGAAFRNRWNLLFSGAAISIGFVSGRPDVILPLALAVEVLYLAVLSMHERFRTVVDAETGQRDRVAAASSPVRTAPELLSRLGLYDQRQFQKLRNQCIELRRVAEGVKGRPGEPGSPRVTDMQIENINRLLWIYLKMLYSKRSLETFFRTTDEQELRRNLERVKERIEALGPEAEDTPQEVKQRLSLLDTAQTAEMRLKNCLTARENYELLQLEIERLHSKIAGIAEMGINRQDTQFITNEIDVVSSSVLRTERTVHDLESFTGYSFGDAEPPPLLDLQPRKQPQRE
jgi:hypothetical protein